MDEARIGQKGRVTHVWYQKGVRLPTPDRLPAGRGPRPRGLHQQGFASAHLFGAVCPERDAGVALAMPQVSTAAMGLFLARVCGAWAHGEIHVMYQWLRNRRSC